MTPALFVIAMFASFFGGVLCDRASFPLLAAWSKEVERTINDEVVSQPTVQPKGDTLYDRATDREKRQATERECEYDKDLFCKASGLDPAAIRGS